jgi:hypothetical protein
MTTTFQADFHIPYSIQAWALIAILPALLAAGVLEKSSTTIEIPEEDTYRTPLSDALFESLRWRAPQEEENNWRIPPPPPIDWRAKPAPHSESSSSNRNLELFPRYQPGRPSDFDLKEHEEKPLIKLFEFGTK